METEPPLRGLKVIDVSTLFAGPFAAMLLGDFGAEVTKIEHPRGDPARGHGDAKNGVSLLWKMVGRNKRAITLDIGKPLGQQLFRRLAGSADIIIENFRPGTLERWGLGYDVLSKINPRLILVRVTGFGQIGPCAGRPGFGTLAEAMSGFASMNGFPDGPPTLPPFGLADGIAGMAAAFASLTAVCARKLTGLGQVVDVALIEPILAVLGAQPLIYDQLRRVPRRMGNRSAGNAPRNIYRTADGKWLAISTSSQSIAERLMQLIGAAELIAQPWFSTARGRVEHVEELDARVSEWIGKRTAVEVTRAMTEAQAAVAPVYDIADIFADEQFRALNSIVSLKDDELGEVRMQNVIFRLSRQPGEIRWAGRPVGADNEQIYVAELGMTPDEVATFRSSGII